MMCCALANSITFLLHHHFHYFYGGNGQLAITVLLLNIHEKNAV